MSSHSDGLGSRNGWNSPDQTNSRVPSTSSEYGSKVICVRAAGARRGGAGERGRHRCGPGGRADRGTRHGGPHGQPRRGERGPGQ